MTSSEWWNILSRSPATRRREFATLHRLAQLFEARGQHWQVGTAGFEARASYSGPGVDGVVVYKVHLVGWEEHALRFHGSVTLFPRTVAAGYRRTGVAPRTKTQWYEDVRRVLRRHGYTGRWHRVPGGKMGDFWRKIPDVRHLRMEVKRMETWVAAPPWL